MSAEEILSKRMEEVADRKRSERETVAALFERYPDLKAISMELKEAFAGEVCNFKYAVHGPVHDTRMWYPATMESFGSERAEVNGKKGRKG